MTHEDAFDKLKHAAELVAEVAAEKHALGLDLRGRFAIQDAAASIDRVQASLGVAMRAPAVRS